MNKNAKYDEYVVRARAQYGSKLDLSAVPSAMIQFFRGPRVRVVTTYHTGETYTRTGVIGITTGHKPALLLIHRSNSFGSFDVLGINDVITHVQRGRAYVPVMHRIPPRPEEN